MTEVKLKLTLGLVGLVLLGAFANTAFDRALPKTTTLPQNLAVLFDTLPLPQPSDYGTLPQPIVTSEPPVNRSALDELKQQGGGRRVYNPNTGEHVLVPELAKMPGSEAAVSQVPTEAPKLPGVNDTLDLQRLAADTQTDEVKGGRWVRGDRGQTFWCASCDPVIYPTVPTSVATVQESQLSRVARERGAKLRSTSDGRLFAEAPAGQVWAATGERGTHASTDHNYLISEILMGTRYPAQQVPTYTQVPQTLPGSYSIVNNPLPVGSGNQVATPKAFELSLYLDNSQRSQILKRWFETDPDLQYIRSQCNFQVYTPDNPVYRTRLTNVVPVQNFPACVLTFADGGHIHATAENYIPTTSKQLASDLYYFSSLAADARRTEAATIGSPLTGGSGAFALKTGYSFDKAINPSMRLMMSPTPMAELQAPQIAADPQCVDSDGDGVCDDPAGGGFIARARAAAASKNAVAWVGPSDVAVVVLGGLILLLAYVVAKKHGYIGS